MSARAVRSCGHRCAQSAGWPVEVGGHRWHVLRIIVVADELVVGQRIVLLVEHRVGVGRSEILVEVERVRQGRWIPIVEVTVKVVVGRRRIRAAVSVWVFVLGITVAEGGSRVAFGARVTLLDWVSRWVVGVLVDMLTCGWSSRFGLLFGSHCRRGGRCADGRRWRGDRRRGWSDYWWRGEQSGCRIGAHPVGRCRRR